MDYYNIRVLSQRDVAEIMSLEDYFNRPLGIYGRRIGNRTHIFARCYEYLAVSAEDEGAHAIFEDRCRRHLYKMATIKMGYSEHSELEMIRTEKEVQMLRALLDLTEVPFRADLHPLEKIDRDSLLEMFKKDVSPIHKTEEYERGHLNDIWVHLDTFLRDMKSHKKGRCEFYKLENTQGNFFNSISIQEKFYFVHNASLRRILILNFNPVRTVIKRTRHKKQIYPSESSSDTRMKP